MATVLLEPSTYLGTRKPGKVQRATMAGIMELPDEFVAEIFMKAFIDMTDEERRAWERKFLASLDTRAFGRHLKQVMSSKMT